MKFNRFIITASALISAAAPIEAAARPISYQGGWTLIEQTNRQSTSVFVHYTINPRLSFGLRSEWDRQNDIIFNGGQATFLVKRWLGEDFQANIYAFAGAGVAQGVGSNLAPADGAVMGGVIADWETRRWFLSYRARGFEAGTVDKSFVQSARIGVAPYIGKTNDLHTWLMVEVDQRPKNPNEIGVTPLVRLLKGPMLLEAGWSLTDNEPLVNFTYRF